MGVTPLIVAQWVLYSFYFQKSLCAVTIYIKNCSWYSWCVTSPLYMYSWMSATPTLQCHLWLGFLVPTFWSSDSSLVDHSMNQGPPYEIFDPFSVLGRKGVRFVLQNQPCICLKSLSTRYVWEDLLHLCQELQPFVTSCHLAHLDKKKNKATNPLKRYQSWPEICSVRLPHLRSYLPPWKRSPRVIFWAVSSFSTF